MLNAKNFRILDQNALIKKEMTSAHGKFLSIKKQAYTVCATAFYKETPGFKSRFGTSGFK